MYKNMLYEAFVNHENYKFLEIFEEYLSQRYGVDYDIYSKNLEYKDVFLDYAEYPKDDSSEDDYIKKESYGRRRTLLFY